MSPQRPFPFRLRAASLADVPALVALNHAAYPDLVAENVVWSAPQLVAHLAVFPEGQIVVERTGDGAGGRALVGAISTLLVDGRAALRPHTWLEITSDGRFTTHDERGDTLYLADVYVHPDAQGRGVGAALYGALRDACRARRCARVVAGGRLWGYAEHAARLSPEAYVAEVRAGRLHDPVLVSQLRAGFVVRAILPGYLDDPRSRSFATLLEWANPDHPSVHTTAARSTHGCSSTETPASLP